MLILFSSATAFTVKLEPFQVYITLPVKTEPKEIENKRSSGIPVKITNIKILPIIPEKTPMSSFNIDPGRIPSTIEHPQSKIR